MIFRRLRSFKEEGDSRGQLDVIDRPFVTQENLAAFRFADPDDVIAQVYSKGEGGIRGPVENPQPATERNENKCIASDRHARLFLDLPNGSAAEPAPQEILDAATSPEGVPDLAAIEEDILDKE